MRSNNPSSPQSWNFNNSNNSNRRLSSVYEAYQNAYNKAIKVEPMVIPLVGLLTYAVESSEGGYYTVELHPANGGEVEGATCTCRGGGHLYCYHRMAAYLFHCRRITVMGMMGYSPEPQPVAAETETKTEAEAEEVVVVVITSFKSTRPAPAAMPSEPDGPVCKKCGTEITSRNMARFGQGLCQSCWAEQVKKDSEDLLGF